MGLGDPLRTLCPLCSRVGHRRPPPPVSSPTPLTPGSPQPGLLKAKPSPSTHPAAPGSQWLLAGIRGVERRLHCRIDFCLGKSSPSRSHPIQVELCWIALTPV